MLLLEGPWFILDDFCKKVKDQSHPIVGMVLLYKLWEKSQVAEQRQDTLEYADRALDFISQTLSKFQGYRAYVHGGFVRRLISVLFSESRFRAVRDVETTWVDHEFLDESVDIDFVVESCPDTLVASIFPDCTPCRGNYWEGLRKRFGFHEGFRVDVVQTEDGKITYDFDVNSLGLSLTPAGLVIEGLTYEFTLSKTIEAIKARIASRYRPTCGTGRVLDEIHLYYRYLKIQNAGYKFSKDSPHIWYWQNMRDPVHLYPWYSSSPLYYTCPKTCKHCRRDQDYGIEDDAITSACCGILFSRISVLHIGYARSLCPVCGEKFRLIDRGEMRINNDYEPYSFKTFHHWLRYVEKKKPNHRICNIRLFTQAISLRRILRFVKAYVIPKLYAPGGRIYAKRKTEFESLAAC